MISVKQMRALARSLTAEKFKRQMGPFTMIQRPPEESLAATQKMGLPAGAAHTAMARPEDISRGILSLLFEFEDLEIATLPPVDRGEAELTVGRLPDCELVLDHPSVSKRHAALRWDLRTGRCTLRDLGSTNGTFVNSSLLVRREVALRDGDILSFGEVQFWYLLTDTLYDKVSRAPSGGQW